MKLYSSNETNKQTTQSITSSGTLTTFFASKSEPIEILGSSTQTGTPTPSSPIPIENVTGRQEIDVVGKNLFSGNYSQFDSTGGTGTTYGYFKLPTENETYTLTMIAKNDFTPTMSTYLGFTTNGGSPGANYRWCVFGGQSTITKGTKITITNLITGGLLNYVSIYSPYATTLQTFTDNFYIQLEKGSSATDFEPYISNSYDLNLGEENLLNINDITPTDNGIILTKTSRGIELKSDISYLQYCGGTITINNLEANTDYYLDYTSSSSGTTINEVFYILGTTIYKKTNYQGFSFNTGNYTSVTIIFGVNFYHSTSYYDNIMLTKGTTKQPYSPYGNPLELCKIGNYQDRIFKSKGYNLISSSTRNGNSLFFNGATTQENYIFKAGTYTLSYVNPNTTSVYIRTATTSATSLGTGSPRTFTSNEDFNIWIYRSGMTDNETTQIMLNKGTTALSYEPYGEPSWYIEKQIGKEVFTSCTYAGVNGSGETSYQGTLGIISDMKSANWGNGYSNYFVKGTAKANNVIRLGFNDTTIYVYTNDSNFADTSTASTWLSTHNTIVYYVLSTPTYTKITDTRLISNLNSLLPLLKGTNNIFVNSTGAMPSLKITYKNGFLNNGLGFITDILEAKITEQINGDYYLDLKVPINSSMAQYLVYDNIIKCKTSKDKEQFFRIKRVVKDFTTMSIYATHIFYDLIDNVLLNVAPTGLSCNDYGQWLLSHSNYWTPFTFTSDIVAWSSGRYIRKNIVESIIGDIDNSMLQKFGGEIVRDNFSIALNYNRGKDNGVKLLFGKNIKEIEITTDITNLATRIIPLGFDGLMIPEKYIDSPLINDYPQPKMVVAEFSDIKYEPIVEGETPSEDDGVYHVLSEAEQALRDKVQELYTNGADKPQVNIKIDWIELSKTNEYSQYADLEKANIGDILTAHILDTDYKAEVNKIVYNVLTDRIDNFEIGTISASITTQVNGNTQAIQNFNANEILSSAANNAGQQIINALGGVYGQIGGFKISSDKLWCEYFPPADFTSTDLTKVRNYLLDPVSNPLTDEEKALYDLFGDGNVNSKDLLYMNKLIELGITTTNPLTIELRTGKNIMDSAFSIIDGNNNHIVDININGFNYLDTLTTNVYKTGDEYALANYNTGGLISSDTKRILFSIPLNGKIKNGTPTITSGEVVLRGLNGYLNGSSAGATITPSSSGYTWSIANVEEDHLTISILKSSAFTSVSNNTPVSVMINSIGISFS